MNDNMFLIIRMLWLNTLGSTVRFSQLFTCFLLLFCSCEENTTTASPEHPNLLLILVDDLGYGDLSSAGNPHLKTPHLDTLAAKSVSFEHFYVSPVCAPTRASLLTGRYPQRSGVYSVTNGFESMAPEAVTLGELLQPLGYRTGLFGKWHLGEYFPMTPEAQGFDDFVGFRTGHHADYFDPVLEHNGKDQAYQGYITDLLTKEALTFMKQPDSPFFCYLSLNAPHTPLQVDSTFYTHFLEQGLNERTARVYGMIENIDDNIGRLLDQLDQIDKLRETIVIFMSDNGPISGWRVPQEKMRYNAGLRDQKFTIYEGGIRTQCFWYWQDQWEPKVVQQQLAAHIDLVPTFLDIISEKDRTKEQPELDGLSLLPVLLKQKAPDTLQNRILFQNYHLSTIEQPSPFPGGIALQWPFKMAEDSLLFQLSDDPSEAKNVATEQPEALHALREAYLAWWHSLPQDTSEFALAIPVGYAEENPVLLQPHHGKSIGKVKFLGQRGLLGERIGSHPSGVDGDWLGGWEETGDGARWLIDIHEAGSYEVAAVVRGNEGGESAKFTVEIAENNHTAVVSSTQAENWEEISLIELALPQGTTTVAIRLESPLPPGNQLEVRGLSFRKKP